MMGWKMPEEGLSNLRASAPGAGKKDAETGEVIQTIGVLGNDEGEFYKPAQISVDVQGNLYVTDAFNYRIQKFNPNGDFVKVIGFHGDAPGAFARPKGLSIDDEGFLLQTRPAFGGNIMATILTEYTRPQMSTVRPHVMPLPAKDTSRSGEIVRETAPVREEDIAAKVLEIIEDTKLDSVDVAAADIIVSGGRGMCNTENYTILQELADELGGVVGCSRAAVEAGWMPLERQVGQTGKTVRPKIYIACGISGAIQHLVGMQDSDVIIAINRDKQAPIFEVATFGIVGDLFEIIPAITNYVRELKAKKAGAAA